MSTGQPSQLVEGSGERERDRLRLLVEVNNAVVSNLDLQDLLQSIAAFLRQAIPHDVTGLVVYDEKSNELRAQGVEGLGVEPTFRRGTVLPFDGHPAGLAFTSRKTVLRERIDLNEFSAPVYARYVEEKKLRSGCSVPLFLEDRAIGVVSIYSVRESAFTRRDAELVEQIAPQLAIAVANAVNFKRASLERDRNQLLLEIGKAVTSNLTLKDLLLAVSGCLKQFINHESSSVVLLDEESGQLRVHALQAPNIAVISEGTLLPMEGSPPGLAIKTRATVLRDRIDFEEFNAPQTRMAYIAGLRSGCSVPLISHNKILGTLNVGSGHEAAFTKDDAKLLEDIAGQVAIAVENALNFQRAQRERDRSRMLLEINNAVTSHLDLRELLHATSESLVAVIPHEASGLALYDAEHNMLRVHVLDGLPELRHVEEGYLIPLERSPAGRAFASRQPVIIEKLDTREFPAEIIERAIRAGFKSSCNVPLLFQDRAIGAAFIGSRKEAAFSKGDADLFAQIAGQLAIAVENAVNFQRATKERERVQTLLEINNAISSNLELGELLRAISACLRDYFKHDFAGLALHDPETSQLVTHALDLSRPEQYLIEGAHFPIEGTLNGLAFTSRKPVVRHRIDPDETSWPAARKFFAEQGLKSYYVMPLLSGGRAVGLLNLGSRQEHALTDNDVELLRHIATQIAIAVENSLVFQEITALKNKLASEKLYLEEEIRTEHNFAEIVGQSTALKKILQQVATVAPTDSGVLLCGETGTGKELIARAIHNLSGRRERTLVKLNCAAIPTGLLESELFGHEKGAFTGAIASRIGRFELAHKGTLLLDEIGEIPLDLQPKLLRVLQEQEFERLGSSRTIKTDVRLIAATNCDLLQMVNEKKFRGDLYYRLNVFPITIPPLRERTDDISLLVGYFTQKHALRMNKRIQTVSKETVEALCNYQWPGNVRELENFIERAVILTSGTELQAPLTELRSNGKASATISTQTPSPEVEGPASIVGQPVSLEEVERAHIEQIVKQTRGVIGGKGGAAEILGLPISTLRNRMKKLGMR